MRDFYQWLETNASTRSGVKDKEILNQIRQMNYQNEQNDVSEPDPRLETIGICSSCHNPQQQKLTHPYFDSRHPDRQQYGLCDKCFTQDDRRNTVNYSKIQSKSGSNFSSPHDYRPYAIRAKMGQYSGG